MSDEEFWASALSAVASPPVHDPGTVLKTAVRLGPGVAPRDRRSRMRRAEGVLMAWEGPSRPEAFAVLTRGSREQRRSIHGVADDVLRDAGDGR